MTRWIEDATMEAPEGHLWVKPAPDDCPDCECCSARLCEKAREKNGACHWYGRSADFDLSQCPCWRKGNDARLAAEVGS